MKGDICEVKDCKNLVRSGTICQVHWWRMNKYNSYDEPSRKQFGELCKIEGCKKNRYGRNSTCGMHKTRFERYNSYELPLKIKPGLPDGIIKNCKIHGFLTREKVYLNPTGKYKVPQCIECKKVSTKKYLEKIPSRHRNKYQKEEYERLFKIQNGKCAICKNPEISRSTHPNSKKNTKRLSIDNCHETQENTGIFKIIGLLCHPCNMALGAFKDSIPLLQSAIEYLKSHEELS